jgi:putative membrane protein
MRWIHLTIIILFVAATLIFALQNLKSVTVAFLGLSIDAPLAVLVFVIYVLGALTGSSLFALLRRSYEGSRRGRTTTS